MSGVRRYAAGALALVAAAAGWRLTCLPEPSTAEPSTDFSFHARALGPPSAPGDRALRPVAPGYANLQGWVSALGAGVAMFDVDDEAVADDLCLVDPRRDTVTVAPAPGTPRGYRPFTLVPPDRRRYQAPTGCLPADLDQDGWEDLVVYYWGRSPSLFLRVPKVPPSGAAFRHRALTTEPEVWNTSAATVGDFDGDGRLDLVFGNYFPDGVRVLGGAPDGDHSGDHSGDHGAAVLPDSLSAAANGGGERLYLATGPARFTEARGVFDEVAGRGWTLALGTQDLDGDGRPELYVANDFGPDRLLVNTSAPGTVRFTEARGTRHLTTPASGAVGRDSFKGMGVGFTDLNADGVPDILVSNLAGDHWPQESNFAFVSRPGEQHDGPHDELHDGHAPYDDLAEELGLSRSGWSWDVKAADFDNDGTDEITHATGFLRGEADRWARLREAASASESFLSHPALWPGLGAGDDLSGRDTNTFFTRGGDGRYTDVARRAGVGGDAIGRALAVGDVDDDGRLDLAVANQWSESVLYLNHGPTAPFVGLRLRLPAGPCPAAPPLDRTRPVRTRPAIGAVATVRLPGGGTPSRQLYPANGHNGVSAPELSFGLGDEPPDSPVPVEISWRDTCGGSRSASISLGPGWHRVLLADGRASEIRRP